MLTGNAGEKLLCEMLNLAARKRHKSVPFQKVEHTLSEEIRDDTYVVSEVKAIAEVYTFIAIESVVV